MGTSCKRRNCRSEGIEVDLHLVLVQELALVYIRVLTCNVVFVIGYLENCLLLTEYMIRAFKVTSDGCCAASHWAVGSLYYLRRTDVKKLFWM